MFHAEGIPATLVHCRPSFHKRLRRQLRSLQNLTWLYLYPLLSALFIAGLLWKFFVPRQLSALQVAFEIDDNLYEVHRLTRTVDDARDILQQGRVAFGVGLYMMGMLGVLLLIAELLFQPQIYFEPNLWIIGLFVLHPNSHFSLGNDERSTRR